ncbi:MAG: winged helix DNA-binding domain-containing protein [Ignavibacteriae bacterium]|nr:winged helix DNA-binding domain-containing protein [Ignavibacteriota bacterium]
MTDTEILHRRLVNQSIARTTFTTPAQVVASLGAVQAQVFDMATWAVGLRLTDATYEDVKRAFNKGAILRTHLLRPTWHFVAPKDIRWMLKLTSPRVHAANASAYRKLELDTKVFTRSNAALEKALRDEPQLTRLALREALERAKISTTGIRFGYLLMYAELEGVICSGPKLDKQFTYALLEKRVPPSKLLNRNEALRELTKRYFTTRGPATLHDYVWWSGLTVKEAKEGIAELSGYLTKEIIDGHEYYFVQTKPPRVTTNQSTFLFPDYDEYGISYKNRNALFGQNSMVKDLLIKDPYIHIIIADGQPAGTWQRTLNRKSISVTTRLFPSVSKEKRKAIQRAVARYQAFIANANMNND